MSSTLQVVPPMLERSPDSHEFFIMRIVADFWARKFLGEKCYRLKDFKCYNYSKKGYLSPKYPKLR